MKNPLKTDKKEKALKSKAEAKEKKRLRKLKNKYRFTEDSMW